MPNIAVIGGGASGLTAAISVKKANSNIAVTVFERLDRLGKKIAVTGNGRCNISNKNVSVNNFHGENPSFTEGSFINGLTLQETENFFNSLGVIFKEGENGKLYPYSLQASSVCDALRFKSEALGVDIRLNTQVNSIKAENGGFLVNGEFFTAVIIACGGMSGGKIATDSGYLLLKSLNHTITPLSPAIVQIKTDTTCTKQLKGVKCIAKVTANGKTDIGEVLFCDYGISGPPVMQLSRFLKNGDTVYLNLMPEYTYGQLVDLISARTKILDTTCSEFFCGMLQKRLGQVVLKLNGFSINDKAKFTKADIENIAALINTFPLKVTGNTGFANAQVTHGGAKTSEFNSNTLMSEKVNGLFACGEVLDIDGDCGGYNLQWAWSSGYLAGMSAAKYAEGIK